MEELRVSVKDIALALTVPGDAILARAKLEAWPVAEGAGSGALFNVPELPEEVRPYVRKHLRKKLRQRPLGDEYTIQQLAEFFGRSWHWVATRAKDEEWPFELRNGRKIFKLSNIPKDAERKSKPSRPDVENAALPDIQSHILQCFENVERIMNEATQEVLCILEALNRGSKSSRNSLAAPRNRSARPFFLCPRRVKNIRRKGVQV
jgi:hypothetical protein